MLKKFSNIQTELKELTAQVNSKHQQCQAEPTQALFYAYVIGNLLLQINSILPKAEWQKWLKICCSFSEVSAQTYMAIARNEVPAYQLTEVIVDKDATNASNCKGQKTEKILEKSAQYFLPQAENTNYKSVSKTTKENSNKSEKIIFYIPGNVVPKARPRVTSNGTYLPPRYRKWRNMAEVEIYRQILDLNISQELPIKKAAISLRFCGKHRTNSDLDNMAGACLDALTLNGAGVLKDDRLSCIPQLNVEYVADDRETGVWITIKRID